ncbi:MAG TPA: septal ring lytic transglycosylase RlpA family protein [Nevskiaceae bacterium]
MKLRSLPGRGVLLLAIPALLAACSAENIAYRYTVDGRTYGVLRNANDYDRVGVASWYGPAYQGRPTASGQVFDMYSMTAASKVLPFYTYVRVTNLDNDRSAVVLINDRGPFYPGRIIDLSYASAQAIGMARQGVSRVRVQVLPDYHIPAPPTSPPVSAPPPAPPTALVAAHAQYLQAGLFVKPRDAERLRAELLGDGLTNVQLVPALYSGEPATIVVVGPLFGSSAVSAAQDVLAARGVQSVPYPQQ